jgi:hypothetical protein
VSSTVWTVPATRSRETYILRFLKDAKCSVRVVEVRLFKKGRVFDLVPEDRRRWEPVAEKHAFDLLPPRTDLIFWDLLRPQRRPRIPSFWRLRGFDDQPSRLAQLQFAAQGGDHADTLMLTTLRIFGWATVGAQA